MSMRMSLFSMMALMVLALFAEVSMAQGPGGRGRATMWGRGGGALGLIGNEQIREELDLVDDQVEELEELQQEMRDEMRSMFEGMRDLDRDERRQFFEDMRGKMEDKAKDYEKRINQVLLPHQQKRLKQIQFQMGNRRGVANNPQLAEELGLTEEQIEKLRTKAEDVQKKLNEKIAKLRQQASDEIISVLSPEQQKKYKELVGEAFEMRPRTPQFGRGGRGNRGGDRGSDF